MRAQTPAREVLVDGLPLATALKQVVPVLPGPQPL